MSFVANCRDSSSFRRNFCVREPRDGVVRSFGKRADGIFPWRCPFHTRGNRDVIRNYHVSDLRLNIPLAWFRSSGFVSRSFLFSLSLLLFMRFMFDRGAAESDVFRVSGDYSHPARSHLPAPPLPPLLPHPVGFRLGIIRSESSRSVLIVGSNRTETQLPALATCVRESVVLAISSSLGAMMNGGGDAPKTWRPRPLVVCGPSGAGKSTLIANLRSDFGDKIGFSVSHTTRKPRPGETNGVEYHFVTKEEMAEGVARGDFIETAVFAGNTYGTSKAAVSSVLDTGKLCLLDIEIQGVRQLKAAESAFDPPPTYVFVRPPSLAELEKRLRSRGTETDDAVRRRLDIARVELEYGEEPGNFDVVVVNDDLDAAYAEFRAAVEALFESD